jgi:hypothetical protein
VIIFVSAEVNFYEGSNGGGSNAACDDIFMLRSDNNYETVAKSTPSILE